MLHSCPVKNVVRVLWALVGAGLLIYVALTLWLSFSAIVFPYTLDYGEGDVFWFTRKLAHAQNIYTPLGGPPFDSSNYPPVAMLLTAALYPLFGDSLAFGRWLNLAAALATAAFIIRWVRSEAHDWRAALVAGALFLGSTFVYHWVPLYRVDLIGLAFTLAGIFFVWRWERGVSNVKRNPTPNPPTPASLLPPTSSLNLMLALLLFLLALYTKHSLLFAPAAAALAIFLRDKRAGIFFGLSLLVLGGILFAALELWTAGGWSFGLIALNATVWTPRIFLPLLASFVVTYAAILGLGAWGWWTRVRARKFGILEIYAVASLASLALAGREGAWENYFFEAIALTCVFAGISIAVLARKARWQWALPLLLLVQLGLFWNEHDPRIALKLFDEVRAGNMRVGPLVRQAAGTVIAEDMGLLWTNGKPVDYYSFAYSTLARAGRYDQRWETENLRAGSFPLVILNQGTREDVDRHGNFTRAFVSALDYGYDIAGQDARYVVYEPAPLQATAPQANFGDTFELVGWSLNPPALKPGAELELTLVWRALKTPTARYTAFAHLADAQGGNLAQDDHEPLNGIYPTTRWARGELVRDTFRLSVPENLAPGEYGLRVGWYDTVGQDRLGTSDGADFVFLKPLTNP